MSIWPLSFGPQLQQRLKVIFLVTCAALLVIFSRSSDLVTAQDALLTNKAQLPPLQTHPLPSSLAQWYDPNNQGDYFSQVTPTDVGYFIWTQFPIKVYLEQPTAISPKASQAWIDAVLQAVQEWSTYLPLQRVSGSDSADITIWRSDPNQPIKGRIRSAETRYELYVSPLGILSHRFTILIRPRHVPESILAATRHELGHALGIWGHSPLETDALYFSQVRNPSKISVRDVNTLKRVYEQPTRLGWPLVNSASTQINQSDR
jgi:predicted Zn-dependent protease